MPLSAATLAAALRTADGETLRLRAFLDDLDGWDGQDCDTGTNAHLTLSAMAASLGDPGADRGLPQALERAVEAGVRCGVGHVGVLLTSILRGWEAASESDWEPTPVGVRRMLCVSPWEVEDAHMAFSVAVESMFDEATSELQTLGDTLPDIPDLVSLFSAQAQYGLVNATSERTGRVDAGAAVLAVLFASLDATLRGDTAVLDTLAQMLADLAASPGAASPRPQAPGPGEAFTVDVLLWGTDEDARAALAQLDTLGVRHSCVGRTDLFGVGTWRLHVDTSAPLAVRPRHGVVRRFQVVDARPDDMIGEDQLLDGVTHRGVRLLERHTLRLVERVAVVACTRAPGLVEDLAQAGALVLLDPDPTDADVLEGALARSTTGVCLVAPCDQDSADWARSCARGPGTAQDAGQLLVADSRDDLSALVVAQACAPMFVPHPGGTGVAPIIAPMLTGTAAQSLRASTVIPLPHEDEDQALQEVMAQMGSTSSRRHRVLVGAGDGPTLVAVLRQMIAAHSTRGAGDLEVIDGGQAGPSLFQGLR